MVLTQILTMETLQEEKNPAGTIVQAAGEHVQHLSYWPIALAMSAGFMPFGIVMYSRGIRMGLMLLAVGAVLTLGSMIGWSVSLLREKLTPEQSAQSDRWLRLGLKLFLVSETAIFGAFFAHYYYSRMHHSVWPPQGAPHLYTSLPAIATLILMISSGTVNRAHHLLQQGKNLASRRWIILTMALGAIFLSIQGYEWGFLKAFDDFTYKEGVYGTLFYIMTGFHGLHVATGLLLLLLVYIRLRLGHFTPQRHFAFLAATWYWHFVDVIWIFLFGTIYLL